MGTWLKGLAVSLGLALAVGAFPAVGLAVEGVEAPALPPAPVDAPAPLPPPPAPDLPPAPLPGLPAAPAPLPVLSPPVPPPAPRLPAPVPSPSEPTSSIPRTQPPPSSTTPTRSGAAPSPKPATHSHEDEGRAGGASGGSRPTPAASGASGLAGRDRAGSRRRSPRPRGRHRPRHTSSRAAPPPRRPSAFAARPVPDQALDARLGRVIERFIVRMPLWGWMALAGLAAVAFGLGMFALRERRRSRSAERVALRDPLTGVGNRLAFDHHLAIAWERAKRYDEGLGVLVLDLDGFKEINDTGGHQAGDDVLRKVGQVITSRARRSDAAARLGGDEFVLLTTGPGVNGIATLAEGLRASLKENGVDVSLGWATRTPNDKNAAEIIHRADLTMYDDKAHRKETNQRSRLSAVPAPASEENVAAG